MRELLLLISFLSINAISQELCESPESKDIDLNTISVTKCTIKEANHKKNKKARLISVTVSANRRHLKKRAVLKKQQVTHLASVGIAEIKETPTKATSAATVLKSTIEGVKNKLSIQALKKASKFNDVDKIPLFNSCKKVKKAARIDCFNEKMVAHISKHFSYPSTAIQESIQGEVWVRFIIDKNGEVKNIKTLGPKNGEALNKEAIRVVSKLPQFIPAKKDGGRISVKYGFPISFALEE
ncbi:energy transducer TonB [Tenacibaculum finnmarkense genomovar finnmarkense]|uniref:energy transducer TonB n=1 Tax=Tenacibaculum finnmarkense TaxID=2781243 RepID=UPI00187B9195|nr:energy transducer TonB [Tenacibaculum finnmarkense]MBE7691986.1 TonB family protein [Tenacibaculum finnmarkense genomovar finnmarkense]MCD8417144.1 energy transducer TonB [Tenacibaculum finnmarkense genomovar finnmarkense]MCD8446425.1 energy transducer TonB [Tenacibaculum finnmarkense genomovar finnmarkense]MCD8453449.1 energy transducer TonB [Tenacibaculum finnmarkense genomovar ulcerans]MCG8184464.1 energy transducer TonB [Tenacibaculum finnmarkense genomovar finnmarkense]